MVPNEATQYKLVSELSKYKIGKGMFGAGQAIKARDARSLGK